MANAQDGVNPFNEEQRLYELYLENQPTVNISSYEYIILEAIPLCISLELEDQSVDANDTDSDLQSYKSHHMLYKYSKLSQQEQEKVLQRIYSIGFGIGSRITDMLIFSKNPNFHFQTTHNANLTSNSTLAAANVQKRINTDLLSIMKFICRDVWKLLFNKQIDNLKTNHKGTFYLSDKKFKFFENFGLESSSKYYSSDMDDKLEILKPYLEICSGVIKGVLNTLEIKNVTEKDQIICSYEFPKEAPLGEVSFNIFVPIK